MSVDVVTEMNRLWSELGQGIRKLDAKASEAEIEKFLGRVVLLRGVEIQVLFPALEDIDDEADVATAAGVRRSDTIQSKMEKLSMPPSASAWRALADAVVDHVETSPTDVGERLEALSPDDRADLGERVKSAIDTLA